MSRIESGSQGGEIQVREEVREVLLGLMNNVAAGELEPKVSREVELVLESLLSKIKESRGVPDFVIQTASPLGERHKEGRDYTSTLRLMERSGIVSRGNREIWEGGGYMWMSNGMRLKENIFGAFEGVLDELGYGPFQTPRVLPKEIIDQVIAGIVDLTKGTYWLAEKRDGEFRDSGRFANSTNDPVINYHLADALKDDKTAFPFKGYSRHPMIRSHSVARRPMVNSDENMDLFEAYSIQETREECEAEFEKIIATMQAFFERLGISFLTVDQSMWGNKPVAKKVTSLQTYAAPVRGSVRLATIYMHDDTFAKVFGVFKKGQDGKKEYAHQVGFGFWEGMFLPIIDHLSDKHGLCLPPDFAPDQLVIVPKTQDEEQRAIKLAEEMKGFRVRVDDKYNQPTQKRMERLREKGVPLRLKFNGDEQVTFSRRDTLKTHGLGEADLINALPHLLSSMTANYKERSRDYAQSHLVEARDTSEIAGNVQGRKLVIFNHCGTDECGQAMEKEFPGEFLGHVREFQADGCCIGCGKEARKKGLIGKRAPTP